MANWSVTTTSGGSEVYFHGELMDGCEIYFAGNTNYPYKALIFETEDEARVFSNILSSHYHPSVSDVLPMEEVSVETVHGRKFIYILPCEKVGVSLMDTVTTQNAPAGFYDGQALTEFARNLLIDLFTVISKFIETRVDISVSPDNIFLVDKLWTVCPSKRTECGTWADYKKMRHLTSFILERAGEHPELRRFHNLLSDATMRVIRGIYKDPIFWTKHERMGFPTILWDAYEHSGMPLATLQNGQLHSPFGNRTLDDVYNNPRLRPWYDATVGNASPSITYPNDAQCVGVELRSLQAHRLLNFARCCDAHFEQNQNRERALRRQTHEDLLNALEDFFPNFIYNLYLVGVRLEGWRVGFRMPVQSCLKDLVSDDDHRS